MSEPYDPLLTQIMPRFVILNFRKFFFSQEKRVPQHRECMKYKCEKFCTQVRYDGEICSSDVSPFVTKEYMYQLYFKACTE